MSYFVIKIIALSTMFIDHFGYILMGNNQAMRTIGRIAFPLFCFLLINGYFHTKDRIKYLVRMMFFAMISEVFFDFGAYMSFNIFKQNVFFTLTLGLLSIMATEKYISEWVYKVKYIPETVSIPIGCAGILALFMAWNDFIRADYGWYGILLIYMFYWTYGSTQTNKAYMSIALVLADFMIVFVSGSTFQMYSILAIPFIMLFEDVYVNVSKRVKIFCYAFYPAHLFILGLIRFLIYRSN